jgi:acetylornithine deacetylase/succinyl-diaminopimelate desuccinylase-like protein
MNTERFDIYIEGNKERFLEEYFDLLRIPSVAAQGRGIMEASDMVKRRLDKLGVKDTQLLDTGGSPVVYGTLGSGNRRLMIYDHYDVQPEDPIDLWTSPPFEPTIRDGKVYARGASDNKGNLMMRLQAIEAWIATQGELPLSIAFVIEGEEEIGSANLPTFCQQHADLLKADGCLWETGEVDDGGRPMIDCGAKGMQYVELVARGAAYDQHSAFAPIIPNPAWRLTWALQMLKDQSERIIIPGFYDRVRPLSAADREALNNLPENDEAMLAEYGVPAFLRNARGAEKWRRLLFEPTCNICGMIAGYTDQGSKTVLPAEARAKLDFRLVPDMEPKTVLNQIRNHLDDQGFGDIEIIEMTGVHPARSPLNSTIVQAAVASANATYDVPAAVYPTMPGTGPMYMLCQQFGTPACSGPGCGYYGDKIHAPDENIRLADYWRGMRWMGRFLHEFGTR